jgi:hypothetical protein
MIHVFEHFRAKDEVEDVRFLQKQVDLCDPECEIWQSISPFGFLYGRFVKVNSYNSVLAER